MKKVVFTQGGKGGVAKTEVVLSLVPWYRQRGIKPVLLDFDIENTNRSGLKNFYPEAEKLDVHKEGTLDSLFDICDRDDVDVVIADLGAGAGAATYSWFNKAFNDAQGMGISFTSIGVTNNDAGAVQSVLKWAAELQDQVDYLIVLNELHEFDSQFEYWYDLEATEDFTAMFKPFVMKMSSRIQEFQGELRNHSLTLQAVIEAKTDVPFLQRTKNVIRAKRYQRELFEGFDAAASILLP